MEKMTKTSQGTFIFSRGDHAIEFFCERCNSNKKSRIKVSHIGLDQSVKTICNGCYGYLLSRD